MSCLIPSIEPVPRSTTDATIVYKADVVPVMNGHEQSKLVGIGGASPVYLATVDEAVDWIESRLTQGFTNQDTIDWLRSEHRDVASAMAHIRADPLAPHKENLEFR